MNAEVLLYAWHPLEGDSQGKTSKTQPDFVPNAPILATDFVPRSAGLSVRVIATAGQDGIVRLWRLDDVGASGPSSAAPLPSDGWKPSVVECTHLADLDGFTCSINTLRFSPNGECLATAGDDGSVIVWGCRPANGCFRWDCVDSPRHLQKRLMRGRCSEIYDLAWSPDSTGLMAGSVDGSVKVWNIINGEIVQTLRDHQGFVQGVSWDPQSRYVATQGASSQSTVRVYEFKPKKSKHGPFQEREIVVKRKRVLGPMEEEAEAEAKKADEAKYLAAQEEANRMLAEATLEDPKEEEERQKKIAQLMKVRSRSINRRTYDMYMDDLNSSTFFRRLEWTVDGNFLLTPAALYKSPKATDAAQPTRPTVYGFMRGHFEDPCFHLPSVDQSVPVAVRCSPILYALRCRDVVEDASAPDAPRPEDGTGDASTAQRTKREPHPVPYVALPYRMIYAVATVDAVLIYDTQHPHPIAMLKDLHYSNMTDMAWSPDGNTLIMSSTDGYCSVARFAEGELGTPLPMDDPSLPEWMRNIKHDPCFFTEEPGRGFQCGSGGSPGKPRVVKKSGYQVFSADIRQAVIAELTVDGAAPNPKVIFQAIAAKWSSQTDAEKDVWKKKAIEVNAAAEKQVEAEDTKPSDAPKTEKRRIELISVKGPGLSSELCEAGPAAPVVNELVPKKKKKRVQLIQVQPTVVVPGAAEAPPAAPPAAPPTAPPAAKKTKKRVALIQVQPMEIVPGADQPAPTVSSAVDKMFGVTGRMEM